jgi:capsular polysaccharide biosynthesis protein
MELRTYWAVVWRWRWLALAVAAVTFVASLAIQTREPTLYQATFRLAVHPDISLTPGEYSPALHYYYEYVATELLIDDVMEIVKTPYFHTAAAARAEAGLGRPVSGAIEARKAHKFTQVTVTADDPDQAMALVKAVEELLLDPQAGYFKMFASYEPVLTVVGEPQAVLAAAPSRAYLYLLLRLALGLIAGLGLAFLLEYLDDTVRGAREVEAAAGLPVLGEIPARGRGRRATAPAETEGRVRTA